jgi:hypothetical protein
MMSPIAMPTPRNDFLRAQLRQRIHAIVREPQTGKDKNQHIQPDRQRRQEREEHHRHHAAQPDRARQRAGRAGHHADRQQRPAVLAQDLAALVAAGVVGQRVVHHHAAGQPAPQQRLHHHRQRREDVQRQREYPQAHKDQHAAQRHADAAQDGAALALLQLRIVAQADMAADHRHGHHANEDQRGQDHQRQQASMAISGTTTVFKPPRPSEVSQLLL